MYFFIWLSFKEDNFKIYKLYSCFGLRIKSYVQQNLTSSEHFNDKFALCNASSSSLYCDFCKNNMEHYAVRK